MSTPNIFSRRALIRRFAASAARLFNCDETITEFDDGSVYLTLADRLSGVCGPQSREYSLHLAGHALVKKRMSPEDAAQSYFECVIERRMFLARANPVH